MEKIGIYPQITQIVRAGWQTVPIAAAAVLRDWRARPLSHCLAEKVDPTSALTSPTTKQNLCNRRNLRTNNPVHPVNPVYSNPSHPPSSAAKASGWRSMAVA